MLWLLKSGVAGDIAGDITGNIMGYNGIFSTANTMTKITVVVDCGCYQKTGPKDRSLAPCNLEWIGMASLGTESLTPWTMEHQKNMDERGSCTLLVG